MSASDDPQQCRALTKEGTRCSRDAVDGQFCHQHDETDPTINDEDASDQEMSEQVEDTADQDDGETGTGAQDASSLSSAANETTEESGDGEEESEGEASGDDSDTSEPDAAESDETGADASDASDASESSAGGVMEVRDTVKSVASELVGYPLDGVIEITRREDGWTAVIEVIERRSVPDTQDILGRYEITLEDAGTVAGYRRTGRHRRSDTGDEIRE